MPITIHTPLLLTICFCIGMIMQTRAQEFSEQKIITKDVNYPASVFAIDLDKDGNADILSASRGDNKIAWYENLGDGKFGDQQVISNQAIDAVSVFAINLDEDVDVDVISASPLDNKIAWYENLGDGKFGDQQVISTQNKFPTSVYSIDLDRDADADVLSAHINIDKIVWYENLGNGKFGAAQTITAEAYGVNSIYATNLDGDEDADVLSSFYDLNEIAWYENTLDENGKFGAEQVVKSTPSGEETGSVYAIDLDGDNDADILSASRRFSKIAWYENTLDENGKFGTEQVITMQAGGASSVYAIDLDGDGDADVLSASADDNKIAWYQNDGKGNFGKQRIISTLADGASSVYAIDLDGDGDADVLSASADDNKIAWYQNQIVGISSLSNNTGTAGDKITLVGQNFAGNPENNTLTIAGVEFQADEVKDKNRELTFTIPPSVPAGTRSFTVSARSQTAQAPENLTIEHTVGAISHKEGGVGAVIMLEGTNFSADTSEIKVSIGGKECVFTIQKQGTQLNVRVPELEPGSYEITVTINGKEKKATEKFNVISLAPVISSISPSGATPPGSEITISGSYFKQPGLDVKIDGQSVGVTDTTGTEIKLTIPSDLADGEYQLTVSTTKGSASTTINVSTDTDPPTLTLSADNADTYSSGDLPIAVEATDEVSGIARVEFRAVKFLESLEDEQWNTLASSGEDTHSVTFSAPDFDEIGLRYQFRATDNAGNTTTDEEQVIVRQYPSTHPVSIANAWSPASADATIIDYQLIAVPFATQPVGNVLEELGAQDETSWRLFQYSEDQSKSGAERAQFTEYPLSLEPGKGYFLIYKHQGGINLTGDLPSSIVSNRSVSISLSPGYNLIGNPYLFPIDWQEVMRHNNNPSVSEQVKVINNGTFGNSTNLDRFEGAFVFNQQATGAVNIEIPLTAKTSSNGRYAQEADTKELNPLHSEAWEVPLRLESDALSHHLSAIGMHPEAAKSADRLDDFTLPRFLKYLELNFHHPEFFMPKFTKDIVPTQDAYTWEFEVVSNLNSPEVTLTWDNHYFGTNDLELMLLDVHNHHLINMREATSYTFSLIKGKRTFKVFYGNATAVKANMLPESIGVGEAYPNPMQEQFTIPLSLPKGDNSYDIRVEIYSTTGQLIKRIKHTALSPGYQTLQWDRRNREGKTVSAGLYFYRVNVNNKALLNNGRIVVQ